MNEHDAEKLGFHYCGPSISRFPTEREFNVWEEDKKIAKRIKREYKDADYVIVSGTSHGWLSSGSKAIYGNANFSKLWHIVAYGHTPAKMKESIEALKAKAEESYKKQLAELDERLAKIAEEEAWLESVKK